MKFEDYVTEDIKFIARNFNGFSILCDMDGVLTDFDDAVRKLNPRWHELYYKNPEMAWGEIVKYGMGKFWRNMSWMPDGKKLWNYIEKYDPWLLTAVPKYIGGKPRVEAAQAKREWVGENLGWLFVPRTKVVLKADKPKYSKSYRILIDDDPGTIRKWKAGNGIGILHKSADRTIKELEKYKKQ